jgi:FKBP-type peptidyl-prolyl cis-trans isomerase FkpA
MKRIVLCLSILALLMIVAAGCSKKSKSCDPVPVAKEEPDILKYISENGITASRDPSGIYYEIINPGSGIYPGNTSKVTINYIGKLLNNTVCDSAQNKEWPMTSLVTGFQIGLPLIKKGGTIKLILPSSYGYGCTPILDANNNVRVPANSILVFDIDLLNVQ